jgi:hypothetical protein
VTHSFDLTDHEEGSMTIRMSMSRGWLPAGAAALALVCATAQAQQAPARVRGSVVSLQGHQLTVNARDGKQVSLAMSDKTEVNLVYAISMADVKEGSFIGVTAVEKGGGVLTAREVHLFPEALRGRGEGHRPWDLEPGSTMTNATVTAMSGVAGSGAHGLTLTYPGGKQQIEVPPGTPIVTYQAADASLLKPGAQVFVIAEKAADGTMSAQRIAVGKDGMKPPM